MKIMISKNERGSVLVEFSLVMPVILLIAFGMLQLIFLVNTKSVLQQAAFDAVRSAAVYPDNTGKAEYIVLEQTEVLLRGIGNVSEAPDIEINQVGDEMRVRVKAKISLLPLIKQGFIAFGGSGQIELTSTAVAKREPFLGQQ